MLRDANNEIRLHPGRFVATLVAIAISVAFIAAISTLVSTEQQSMARFNNLAASRADVVVTGEFDDSSAVIEALEQVDGVSAVGTSGTSSTLLTHDGATVFVSFVGVPQEKFRWASIAEGRWPAAVSEIALSADGLDKLGLSVRAWC